MPEAIWEQIQTLLGLGRDASDLTAIQIALRSAVVYVFTLAAIRLGNKRLLSKATAFDFVVAIMLGSVMSGAIMGSSPLFRTMLVGALLLGMHWLFAVLAYHTDWFGAFAKGERVLLIEDGKVQSEGMRRGSITEDDLAQALRLQIRESDPSEVRLAYLERNGKISVLPYPHEPRIVDVSVERGVQTVRITLE
jgi:uncharacterized membrane protein YcaP (DUF421 family)